MIENLKTTHRGGGYTKVFDMPMANDAIVLNTEGYTHFSVMPAEKVDNGELKLEYSNDQKQWEEYNGAMAWVWAYARFTNISGGSLENISVSVK